MKKKHNRSDNKPNKMSNPPKKPKVLQMISCIKTLSPHPHIKGEDVIEKSVAKSPATLPSIGNPSKLPQQNKHADFLISFQKEYAKLV